MAWNRKTQSLDVVKPQHKTVSGMVALLDAGDGKIIPPFILAVPDGGSQLDGLG